MASYSGQGVFYTIEQILGITDCFQAETAFAVNVKTGDMHRICSYSDGDGSYIVESISQQDGDPYFHGRLNADIRDDEKVEWILAYVREARHSPNVGDESDWKIYEESMSVKVGDWISLQEKLIKKDLKGFKSRHEIRNFWDKIDLLLLLASELVPHKATSFNFFDLYDEATEDSFALLSLSPCEHVRTKGKIFIESVQRDVKARKRPAQGHW